MSLFEENVLAQYGDEGSRWLDALSETVSSFAKRYDLTDLSPLEPMSFNYVLKGKQGSKSIVLKLGVDLSALQAEADALKSFDGFGGVKLFESDRGMLLMEEVEPAHPLTEYYPEKNERATEIVCQLIQKLHAAPLPKEHSFKSLDTVCRRLDKEDVFNLPFVQKAKRLRDELLATADSQVLLHGDLHHGNVLQSKDGWVAIDPKGYVGDPAFDLAAYLVNPIPECLQEDNLFDMLEKRARQSASLLGISFDRIMGWLYVKSVLCYLWSKDDGVDSSSWERLLRCITY